MITSKTSKVGLISWPIEHSLSPIMQNAAFQSVGLDWIYLPLPVRDGQLVRALAGLDGLGFMGCNVSVPYKSKVIAFLDEIDEAATSIGAVNTIKIVNGRYYGSNTDPVGFINNLFDAGVSLQGKSVLVIGAGGAARSIVFALSNHDIAKLLVVDVDKAKLATFKGDFSKLFPSGNFDCMLDDQAFSKSAINDIDLIINASPVGMAPETDRSPWPDDMPLPPRAVVYDIVYNPLMTRLLTRAQAEGHKIVTGLGMLVHQGAASFEIWTGQRAPFDVMMKACQDAINTR